MNNIQHDGVQVEVNIIQDYHIRYQMQRMISCRGTYAEGMSIEPRNEFIDIGLNEMQAQIT